jgi:RNA polymerase sigma-70 factor, ECF subfamily
MTMVDWDALIEEHGPLVARVSWRLLGNSADVEDNVQEVFLEAYRLHDRMIVRQWPAMLRRIATLRALAKRRRRRPEVSLTEVMPPSVGGMPDEMAIGREMQTRLRDAIAGLPEREGAVFALRHFEALDLPEIADSLGISYSAAGAALSRARAKLKRLFQTVTER